MKSAYGIAENLRAGERVETPALIAALDELEPGAWSDERYQAQRTIRHALFASETREGLHRALADELTHAPGTIRAVLLDEGDPLSEPFPENPWGIAPTATLVGAIDHVWDLFEAPRLTNGLLERVLALVLVDTEHGMQLAYVHVHEKSTYEIDEAYAGVLRPPHDRRYAQHWLPFGDFTAFAGAAPSSATHGKHGPVPAPLQRLYRVHAGLHDGMWNLSGPDDLLPWHLMLDVPATQVVRSGDAEELIQAQHLISFFGYGDDRSDLFDIRDPAEPVVRAWGDGYLYEGAGRPFLEWLEDQTSLVLGISED